MSSSNILLRIDFVCTGNICRSPLGHWMMQQKLEKVGLQSQILIMSSGTSGHTNWPADHRSIAVGEENGYNLSRHRARCLEQNDYKEADLLLALDTSHARYMLRDAPAPYRNKIRLLYQYASLSGGSSTTSGTRTKHPSSSSSSSDGIGPSLSSSSDLDIPDPYYDDMDAFRDVYRMVDKSTDGLLEIIKQAIQEPNPKTAILTAVPAPQR